MRCAACIAATIVASCAITPEPRVLPSLAKVPTAFDVTGRIAIRQGQRSDIAKLRWSRTAGNDVWVISSPIGNEVARIESGPGGATLTQAGAAPQQAPDFASLTERILGVSLEPARIAAWLHGGQATDTGEWQVTVDETQVAGAVTLARRITASRGDTVVRFVVDEYQPRER